MRIIKTIGATIGVALSYFYLGCGSVQIAQAGVPNINQVTPMTLVAGSSGATVKVTGSNFSSDTVLMWNGGPVQTTVVDSNTLASPIESASLALPGIAHLSVRNSITGTSSQAVQLTIASTTQWTRLAITTKSLPAATINSSYYAALAATGGVAPYSWTLASGRLPTGISLSPSGLISGTPTVAGSFSIKVSVRDSSSQATTKTQSLTLNVTGPSLTIGTTALPSALVNTTYSQVLQATGGTPGYNWSITSGSLPPGLTLGTSSGTISGMPTAAGNYAFQVSAVDHSYPQQRASAYLSIHVVASSIQITAPVLNSEMVGKSYSGTFQASGGAPSYSWSLASGSLPPGLALSSAGVLAGTPTASGNYTFTVAVSDSENPAQTQTATVTASVSPQPLTITTSALASGSVSTSYSQLMQASGGTPGYFWSIKSGSLPTGISLSSAGTISGTPTVSGAFTFTVQVVDSSNPVHTASAVLTVAISSAAATPLSITNSSLASATTGTAYAQSLAAGGGTPAYTWSVTAGSLPAGLTLSATTGLISGTPTTAGIYVFTVSVHDNGTPIQTVSANVSIAVVAASSQPASSTTSTTSTVSTAGGTTWYIRPDGGTRYSVNVPNGQCDGKADVAYPGSGVNQHCAFNDFRYMWDDGSGLVGAGAWVMAGGDTVIIRGCSALPGQVNASNPNCRLGWDAPTGNPPNEWCYGVGSYSCYNPPIPAGTAAQHTRILGQNYANCNASGATNPKDYESNLTQLFGGFSLQYTFNLQNTQYVDIQCIELTTHNGVCTSLGSPSYPRPCNNNQPLDDYAQNGFLLNDQSSNINFQDVYVHGFNASGFDGPIGGPINMTRVYSGFNAFSGWNFDDGHDTPDAAGSFITAHYVTMIGNGCYEEYPVKDAFPARACYDDVSNGFGDAWSGQDTELDGFICDHCTMAYNTKDAFIGPHTNVKTLTITNSQSYGNMGAQWKWNNSPGATTTFLNNVTVGNCLRFMAPIPGASQSFAASSGLPGAYLSDYCRAAGNTVAINSQQNSYVLFANNTFVDYLDTVFLLSCGPSSNNQDGMCGTTPFVFTNNIFLGYYLNGNLPPGLFYINDPSITVTQSNNVEFGNRANTGETCGSNGNICSDPLLVGEPGQQGWSDPTFLDNFNFYPTPVSPAIGAGTTYTALPTTDYYGITRTLPPTIGAVLP